MSKIFKTKNIKSLKKNKHIKINYVLIHEKRKLAYALMKIHIRPLLNLVCYLKAITDPLKIHQFFIFNVFFFCHRLIGGMGVGVGNAARCLLVIHCSVCLRVVRTCFTKMCILKRIKSISHRINLFYNSIGY